MTKETKEVRQTNEALKGCYGPQMKNSEVKQWLLENIKDNMNREDNRITYSIWGLPGIGKTALVKNLKKEKVTFKGKDYNGFQIIDIPLAQIEEMGDILGLPTEMMLVEKENEQKWILTQNAVIEYHLSTGWKISDSVAPVTLNTPPEWVPKEERPGVILFDDGNRASQRIMKGLMQLVQDYRTVSWKIPAGWSIIFTGNPDNRFNQVTSMDTAQLTRMKHVTFIPDAIEWATWATEAGIDHRLISFVLRYPEMMIGKERTNPRTLAEFGRALKRYTDLNGDNFRKATKEAQSSLDQETVDVMMIFFQRSVELVINPKDIIEDYEKNAKNEIKRLMNQSEPRIDIINVINDRLYAYLVSECYTFNESHIKNIQDWLLDSNLPKDSAYAFVRRLAYSDSPYKRKFLAGNDELLKIVSIGFGKMF